jgi:hypothetical protein
VIITVTATVMDGTVVRWHHTLSAAETHRPAISASRRGVAVQAEYLTDLPPEWVAAATAAYETLRRTPRADMRHLATHRNRGPSNGPLVPVEEAERG